MTQKKFKFGAVSAKDLVKLYVKGEPEAQPRQNPYTAPSDPIQAKLKEIWEDVLKIEKIGMHDSFFELGGNSLKATSLVSKIHKTFDVKIKLGDIFKQSTIEGVALFVKNAGRHKHIGLEAAEKKEYYPMSPAQRRLYMLQQLDPDDTSYNMPQALILEGQLDRTKLEMAFQTLLIRHESLRTSFEMMEDQLVQKIHPQISFAISYLSEESHPAVSKNSQSHKNIFSGFIAPFNLSRAPLFRVGLLKTQETDKHVLLLDIHHIITDGTSQGILTGDFIAIYGGGEPEPLTLQYKDYSQWQNCPSHQALMKEQEAYWCMIFSGEPPVLNLPNDYPRPKIQSSEGSAVTIPLHEPDTLILKNIERQEEVTLYMLLLAVYSMWLSKLAGQEDIVVGTPIAARRHTDIERIVGMFVNTLAIRTCPAPGKSFTTFLKEVKTTTLAALENQEYPFEDLVNHVAVNRDTSRNPLFDAMFAMQNMEAVEGDLPELKVKPFPGESNSSMFDITLDVSPSRDTLYFKWEYCTRLIKPATIDRWSRHFITLLKEAACNPDKKIADIGMLSAEEKKHILSDFNSIQNPLDFPADKTFQQLFAEEAGKKITHSAVVCNDQWLTYGQLDRQARQLAAILRGKGVGPNDITAIMVERSIEMIVGILAILHAGGAYMPIDANYPSDRIGYMLKNSTPRLLLTQSHLKSRTIFSGETLTIDTPHYYQSPPPEPTYLNCSRDRAYVLYTSGSTGKPKGVIVGNRQWVGIGYAWRKEYRLNAFPLRLLQVASITFDVFSGDLARVFLNGGLMIICPEELKLDLPELYRLIVRQQITLFETTPHLGIHLMDYIYQNQFSLPSLHTLILGSDAFKIQDFRTLLTRFPNQFRLINSYGLTEAAIDSTYFESSIAGLEDTGSGNAPIGKPFPNVHCYILDDTMSPCPIGIPGELYIGGVGVADGYLNQPELTASRFVRSPFDSQTLYKTSDMALWRPDGNIEFIGRGDRQVKLRGYRIELGEIENQLLETGNIQEAFAYVMSAGHQNQYLCAYFTASAPCDIQTLRLALSDKLPEYMVPHFFYQLEQFPLTHNGKIDVKALPVPGAEAVNTNDIQLPRDELEKQLAVIWQEILGIPQVGIGDSFFELGGNSILILQLFNRIHQTISTQLKVVDLFSYPTIAQLAQRLRPKKEVEKTASVERDILAMLTLLENNSIDINTAGSRLDTL